MQVQKLISHPSPYLDPLSYSTQRFKAFPGSPYLNIQNLFERSLNPHPRTMNISCDGIGRTLATKKKNTYKSVVKLSLASSSFIMNEGNFALLLKKLKNLRSIEIKNQSCLLISQIDNSVKVLRNLKYLTRVSFDWTKFYDCNLKSLAGTLKSFNKLNSIKISIKQTSLGSLEPMVDSISRGLRLKSLQHFSFQLLESFNNKRDSLTSPMP